MGTCWESIRGGHHFRAWRQNGTEANSGAWFLGYVQFKAPTFFYGHPGADTPGAIRHAFIDALVSLPQIVRGDGLIQEPHDRG